MAEHQLGDNVEFRENSNGEPVLEHTPSGATLVYDSEKGAWTLGDIISDSVSTDDLSITNDGDGSGIDADQIDGYDVQKNGTDGTGIINFKT